MDKSSKYILMCEKATELQKYWSPAHGDFFVGENGRIEGWVSNVHQGRNVVRGVEVRFEKGLPKVTKYTWLPRLDQLMELAQVPEKRFESTTQAFFDWTKSPYGRDNLLPDKTFSSLEQLWLGFVMQSKFGKIWYRHQWVSW